MVKHCDRCKGKTFQEAIRIAYLKSGSARKDAYFNVSLHGSRDRILSSSSTYCNANREIRIQLDSVELQIKAELQLKHFLYKLLKRGHKGNKHT